MPTAASTLRPGLRESVTAATSVIAAVVVLAGCAAPAEDTGRKADASPAAAAGPSSGGTGAPGGAEAAALVREALDVTFAQDHLSSTRRTRNEGTTTLRVALTVRKRPATRLTYEQDGGPLEFHIAAEGSPFLLRVTHPATDLDERYGDSVSRSA
ncbi:hypothetical protein [Streptomyces sp. NPDC003877]